MPFKSQISPQARALGELKPVKKLPDNKKFNIYDTSDNMASKATLVTNDQTVVHPSTTALRQ